MGKIKSMFTIILILYKHQAVPWSWTGNGMGVWLAASQLSAGSPRIPIRKAEVTRSFIQQTFASARCQAPSQLWGQSSEHKT